MLVPPQPLKVVAVQVPVLEQQPPRMVGDWQNVEEEHASPGVMLTPTPKNWLVPEQPTPVVIEQAPLEEQQVPRSVLQTLSGEHVVLSPA